MTALSCKHPAPMNTHKWLLHSHRMEQVLKDYICEQLAAFFICNCHFLSGKQVRTVKKQEHCLFLCILSGNVCLYVRLSMYTDTAQYISRTAITYVSSCRCLCFGILEIYLHSQTDIKNKSDLNQQPVPTRC